MHITYFLHFWGMIALIVPLCKAVMQNYPVSICNTGIIENNQSVFRKQLQALTFERQELIRCSQWEKCFFEPSTLSIPRFKKTSQMPQILSHSLKKSTCTSNISCVIITKRPFYKVF